MVGRWLWMLGPVVGVAPRRRRLPFDTDPTRLRSQQRSWGLIRYSKERVGVGPARGLEGETIPQTTQAGLEAPRWVRSRSRLRGRLVTRQNSWGNHGSTYCE